jgi:hypothetical protein
MTLLFMNFTVRREVKIVFRIDTINIRVALFIRLFYPYIFVTEMDYL